MWIDTTPTEVRLMDSIEDHSENMGWRVVTLATHNAASEALQDSEYAAVKAALTEWHREDGLYLARWVRTPDTDGQRGFWQKDTPGTERTPQSTVAVIDMERELGVKALSRTQTRAQRLRDRALAEPPVTAIHRREDRQHADQRATFDRAEQMRRQLPPIAPHSRGL